MGVSLSRIPHVAHGKHQIGQGREFHESVCPVTLILLGPEILQLTSQRELPVDLIFAFSHSDIRLHDTSLSFDDGLVVTLVHIHQVEFEFLRHLLLHLQVDVLVVEVTHAEETGRIAVGTLERCSMQGFHGFLVQSTYMADVQLHLRAILTAEGSVLLEGIAKLTLEGPFAGCCLRGIGIESRQGVGVLIGKGGHVADKGGCAEQMALRTERHVLAALGLNQGRNTF